MKSNIEQILKLNSAAAAPRLLGHRLCRYTPSGLLKLKIVETEAYHQDDPASHSYRGLTLRTAPMFEAGGHMYVYFTYGMHYCLNLVTGPRGRGEGVLLRAAEPLSGVKIMMQNRGIKDSRNLTNGPGKLAQALGIRDTSLSGKKLSKQTIWLEPPDIPLIKTDIAISPRIGIRQAAAEPLRFYIKGNPFVSR